MATFNDLMAKLYVEQVTADAFMVSLANFRDQVHPESRAAVTKAMDLFAGAVSGIRTKIDGYAYGPEPPAAEIEREVRASNRRRLMLQAENATLVKMVQSGDIHAMPSVVRWLYDFTNGTLKTVTDSVDKVTSMPAEVVTSGLNTLQDMVNGLADKYAPQLKTLAVGSSVLMIILLVVGGFFLFKYVMKK